MLQIYKRNKKIIHFILIIIIIISMCSSSNNFFLEKDKTLPLEQQILYDLQNNSTASFHPRLLINSNSLKKIKHLIITDSAMHTWYLELQNDANKMLDTSPATYELPDHQRLLEVSRTVLQRTINLSLMYKLSGQSKYAKRALKELGAVTDKRIFPDWHPEHFLDTAEMTNAVAIGYDWLYDYLSSREKQILREAIINNSLKPALRVYEGKSHGFPISSFWKNTPGNWNAVCNGGIGMGALAIADKSPKISKKILYYIVKSLKKTLQEYSPDGGMPEGPMYWNYATLYLSFLLSSFESYLGKDYGLTSERGFMTTTFYPIYTTGSFGLFNIGDGYDQKKIPIPQMFWFANKLRDSRLLFYAMTKVEYSALNIVWYKPLKLNSSEFFNLALDKNYLNNKTGISTMRNNWSDNAIFVGIHWGNNQASHSDLDIGDFIVDSDGIRWATELGGDNYNLPKYFDNKGGRWKYYRKRAEGQNTLVINPDGTEDQNIYGKAKLLKNGFSKSQGFAIIDMTNAYEKYAYSVHRGIALTESRSDVVIEDQLNLKQKSEVYWFMHTPAEIILSKDKKTAVLQKNNRRMFAKIISPVNGTFGIMDAKPLPESPNPNGQGQNTNIKKLTIYLNNVRSAKISVILTQNGKDILQFGSSQPLNKWDVKNKILH